MGTPWITIAAADLEDYLVAAQVTALRTAALGGSQSDPFTQSMTDVVNRIRDKIASCKGNQVSATALTVPPGLRWAACYLICELMQTRLPGLRLTDEQKRQCERAEKDLDAIAKCDLAVELPDDPMDPGVEPSGWVSVVNSPCREASREKLKGL
jgi:hypothetical protein